MQWLKILDQTYYYFFSIVSVYSELLGQKKYREVSVFPISDLDGEKCSLIFKARFCVYKIYYGIC